MKRVLYPKSGTVAKVSEISQCNFCLNEAEYDAKTKMGMWAYLCKMHFAILGIGLGTGKGQKLEQDNPVLEGGE